MNQTLDFDEFSEDTLERWLSRAEKELKGKGVESIQVDIAGGQSIAPYSMEANARLKVAKSGVDNSWLIRQRLGASGVVDSAAEAVEIDMSLFEGDRLEEILRGCVAERVMVHLRPSLSPLAAVNALTAMRGGKADPPIVGSICWSPMQFSLSDGFSEFDQHSFAQVLEQSKGFLPLLKPIEVNTIPLNSEGSGLAEELTFAICLGHEIIVRGLELGHMIDDLSASINFKLGTSSNYLFDIARVRTFRQLWASVIKNYQPVHACSLNAFVTVETSTWNKPQKDSRSNLLRLTTEAMAAVIGGADELQINPYSLNAPDADRLSLNIHHLLRHEAGLARAKDPAAGSYYLENASEAIGNLVWKQFNKLEDLGGLSTQEARALLYNDLLLTREASIADAAAGKRSLIGFNTYLSPFEADKSTTSETGLASAAESRMKSEAQ
jgi:methylmalonyl-CoA mutase